MSELDEILQLTDEVERCIDQGDWLEAGQLNARRQALLYDLFDGGADRLDATTRDALRDVLRRNRATVERVRNERQTVAGTANRLQSNSDALESYRMAAGDATGPLPA